MSAVTHAKCACCASALFLILPSLPLSRAVERPQLFAVVARIGHESGARFDRFAAKNQASSTRAKAATLNDFGWLEGRWRGEWGPRTAEQVWTAPQGGLMLGTFRLFEDNKTLLIEVYTLDQKADDVELRLRHFTPDLSPWEKSDATVLRLASFDAAHFVFANAATGEPKRAVFTRINPDTYSLRFEIAPSGGDTQQVEITYHRQKPPRG
jgi:Domain of unknown function (DUF6265)